MKTLFNSKSLVIRCFAVLIAGCFLFTVTHADAAYMPVKNSYAKSVNLNLVAVLPAETAMPVLYAESYSYPVSDQKPVNTNYQLIKHRSLGLIHAQTVLK